MGSVVSGIGVLLIIVTLISAERRSKRRSRELCDRADSQLHALRQNASARERERVGREPTRPDASPVPDE